MSEAMEWPDPADKAHAVEQAKRLRNQAAAGGLKFEAYLPPDLAVWLLDRIEQGDFVDPSEATFVLLGEAHDLAPHIDLATNCSNVAFRRQSTILEQLSRLKT